MACHQRLGKYVGLKYCTSYNHVAPLWNFFSGPDLAQNNFLFACFTSIEVQIHAEWLSVCLWVVMNAFLEGIDVYKGSIEQCLNGVRQAVKQRVILTPGCIFSEQFGFVFQDNRLSFLLTDNWELNSRSTDSTGLVITCSCQFTALCVSCTPARGGGRLKQLTKTIV